jgi:hypothetical protein
MDDQILTLYAKGLTTREIVDAFKEMYDADVSAALISKVTDRVIEQITAWQSRPLTEDQALASSSFSAKRGMAHTLRSQSHGLRIGRTC